jgi:hypothetical protein
MGRVRPHILRNYLKENPFSAGTRGQYHYQCYVERLAQSRRPKQEEIRMVGCRPGHLDQFDPLYRFRGSVLRCILQHLCRIKVSARTWDSAC